MKDELLKIADKIAKEFKIDDLIIKFKDVRRGRARSSIWENEIRITMPNWIFDKGKEYAIYYMIHELTHIILHKNWIREKGHGKEFKKRERMLLKRYGLKIKYARAYPKQLLNLKDEVVYERKRR